MIYKFIVRNSTHETCFSVFKNTAKKVIMITYANMGKYPARRCFILKKAYILAAAAALMMSGCGSVSTPSAEGDKDTVTSTETATAVSETSEVTDDTSAETSADSVESTETVTEDSKEDTGSFPGGLDDDGKGDDEVHFGKDVGFAPGIWWAFCDHGRSREDKYYEFSTDGSVTVISQTDRSEKEFTYAMEDGRFVIYDSSKPEKADAEERGDGALLTFEDDGHTEELVYMGNITFDDFVFYSNEDIKGFAEEYYKKHNDGYLPEYVDVEYSTTGNDIVVHLYEIVQVTETEGHSATMNWYYIDRFTGKGKDFMDEEVDLTEIIESMKQ